MNHRTSTLLLVILAALLGSGNVGDRQSDYLNTKLSKRLERAEI